MAKAFVVNHDKCNGCRNCQIACKDEHVDNDWMPYAKPQPDTGQFWLRVDESVRGSVPKVKVSYIVKLCQHCESPACASVCTDNAFDRRDDGLLLLNPEKCSGCMACVKACPYGAVYANEELGIAQKCTGCAHLLDDGWTIPRCVDACPHDAIRFGDESEFADEIACSEPLIAGRELDKCRVHYLNLPKRFIAGIVIDLEADEVIADATITIENQETGGVAATKTDEFGDFWFNQIDAAHYTLYVDAAGYLPRMIEADLSNADCNTGPIELFVLKE